MGFEHLKVVFLEILNAESCRVFANQVTYVFNNWYVQHQDSTRGEGWVGRWVGRQVGR